MLNSLNAKQWEKARRFTPLPIFAHTQEQLKRVLNSPIANFDSLAQIADKDPALCWHLQRIISHKDEHKKNLVYSARQCLSLLGLQPTVELVKHLPVVDQSDTSVQAYLQQVQTSLFSAQLTQKLTYTREPVKAQVIYWQTLLSRAPLWRLSLLYPDYVEEFKTLLENNASLLDANKQVFGKQSEQQWLHLAQTMRLPKNVIELYNKNTWPNLKIWQALLKGNPRQALNVDRSLLQALNQPDIILHSANGLAQAHYSTPQYSSANRWTKINANILNTEPQDIYRNVRAVQLNLAHQGFALSALGLDKLTAPSKPPIMKQLTPPTAKKTPPKMQSIDYLYQLANQFQQPKGHFNNWVELMQALLDGLEKGVGLEIGGILLKNPKDTYINMTYSLANDSHQSLSLLKINYAKEGLFKKLMHKSGFIQITPDNHDPYLASYAEHIVNAIPQQSCLMSVDSGAAPLGIVLGATKHANTEISKHQQQAFKVLCLKASEGLAALKQTRKPSAK